MHKSLTNASVRSINHNKLSLWQHTSVTARSRPWLAPYVTMTQKKEHWTFRDLHRFLVPVLPLKEKLRVDLIS
jgi:hypothetical protein